MKMKVYRIEVLINSKWMDYNGLEYCECDTDLIQTLVAIKAHGYTARKVFVRDATFSTLTTKH